MSIHGFDQESFIQKIGEVVFPAGPIRSIEHLFGREEYLTQIERALYLPGRNVFIYGDRGVGKSSLGATAAYQYQSTDAQPIFVSGSIDDTFKSIVANIANLGLNRSRLEDKKTSSNVGFQWRNISFGRGNEVSAKNIISELNTIGDAADLLKQVASLHSEKPIVVIDEFDAIKEVDERNKFASLIKQLGDQSINLKFIFTGIGKSLDELLGAHPSAHRQLETIELPRLSWEGRWEIVKQAAIAFNLDIDHNVNVRISMVSDGFPYYVQLITEKMLWEAFDDEEKIEKLTSVHYQLGLKKAISSISAELKRPYEKAVLQRAEVFEYIVWATADGDNLQREARDMYASFGRICKKADSNLSIIDQSRFSEYLRKLKLSPYGEILRSLENRKGWYYYKEKMLRGYVRMQAEANGIELGGELEIPVQKMYVPNNARTGYKGPSVPRGARLIGDNSGSKS